MSNIRISENHGLNPTVQICAWCGKNMGVLILGKLKDDVEAPRQMILDYEPCDECKKLWGKGVCVIEVECGNGKGKTHISIHPDGRYLYPTGAHVVVTKEYFDELYKGAKPGVDSTALMPAEHFQEIFKSIRRSVIDRFEGEDDYLSNFYISPCTYEGITYSSSECAFQAAKSTDPEVRATFIDMKPGKAKRKGKEIALRTDVIWDEVRDSIMLEVVRNKFKENKDIARKLRQTGHSKLVEGNNWGDTYWGQVDGVGENKLGEILMQIREEIRKGELL